MNDQVTSIRKISKRLLTLLTGPLAIALAANVATNNAIGQQSPLWLWSVTIMLLIICLLLYSVGYGNSFEEKLLHLARKLRTRRFRKPRLLILDGTIGRDQNETQPVPMQSNRSPYDWQTALNKPSYKIEVGPVKLIQRKFTPDVVINPFGELYPEADFVSHTTIKVIRDYVWNGGIFINVAGIPFWYRYDPRGGNHEAAGRVERLDDNNPIWKPLVRDLFPNLNPNGDYEEVECYQTSLEVDRFGDIVNSGNGTTIGKFRAYSIDSGQFITMLRDREQNQCIIGALPYGSGFFLLAGVQINNMENNSFEKVVATIHGWIKYEMQGQKP
ncbi:MAG: hypothetical protein H6658_08310 [Ardenticatenaceae bacterium]|nr:hypothetical protein [Ardenticatenaceae bacterium]